MRPAHRSTTTAETDERGSGLIGATFGLVIFLVSLLMVTQVAAHLFTASALRSDVDHAARLGASRRGDEAAVDAEMARLRRRYGDLVVTWSTSADQFVVDATLPSPSHLAAAPFGLGLGDIHSHVAIRRERVR